MSKLLSSVVGIAIVASAAASDGATVFLDAVQDTYVRGGASGSNFNAQGVLVYQQTNTQSSNRFRGLVQFDLSGITETIVDAHLEYYQMPDDLNSSDFTLDAWILPASSTLAGMDDSIINYTEFNATYNQELIQSTLGDLTLADASGSAGDNTYRISAGASADDLGILNARRTNADPSLRYAYFFLEPLNVTGNYRLFGDREGTGLGGPDSAQPIRLVLTTVPEPSSVLIAICGSIGLVVAARRRCV